MLLHGLGRTPRAMWPLVLAGRRRGYRVLNVGYPSRSRGIAEHAAYVARRVTEAVPDGPLDFVTHSLGGIVLRYAVASGLLPLGRVRRVVMLAPPNQGSEVAELLCSHRALGRLARRVLGPCGTELGVGSRAIVRQLPPVPFAVGVIAGSRGLNPIVTRVLGTPNDGTVSVRGTRVAGMRDHLVVPLGHTFIMASPLVLAQTFRFLEEGRFSR